MTKKTPTPDKKQCGERKAQPLNATEIIKRYYTTRYRLYKEEYDKYYGTR